MANTNALKTVIEPEMCTIFCKKHSLKQLKLSKSDLKNIFDGMEPDFLGYNSENGNIYIAEITTSGFMGQRGSNFHIGAVKKVFEAFSKFYLFHDNINNIISQINKYFPELDINSIKCYFLIPEGSRFINALGYRNRLFEKGYMELETIKLTKETEEIMIKTLLDAKNEIMTK